MKTSRRVIPCFAILLGLWAFPLRANAYSYGPACQWIRVFGKVVLPEGFPKDKTIQFTITYQLPYMQVPAALLTNFPLEKPEFQFVFSGFHEKIEDTFFVPPMFFFSKEIIFRYYVKSSDGKWISPLGEKIYEPQNIPRLDLPKNREKEYLCKTELDLGILELKPAPYTRAWWKSHGKF